MKNATLHSSIEIRSSLDQGFSRSRKWPDILLGCFRHTSLTLNQLWYKAIAILGVGVFLASCMPRRVHDSIFTPTVDHANTRPIVATNTYALTRTPTKTATSTSTLTPPPFVPYGSIRRVPMTLMMHPSTHTFDAVGFLREFILILQENHIKVITYQDMTRDPDIAAREAGKYAIITIDDISIGNKNGLNPSVVEMIGLLVEAEYPAVLGVVTRGNEPNSTIIETFKDLLNIGWEIATHTDTHPYLGELSPSEAFVEIASSQDKIERFLGCRPITLILPYGQRLYDPSPAINAGIIWMVGIDGGETYNVEDDVFYVGRQGPAATPQRTFSILTRRFGP